VIDVRTLNLPLSHLKTHVNESDLFVVTTTPYDQVQNYFVDYRLQYALKTINFLKENFPKTPLVICGSHGTVRPDLILRDSLADIVIKGELEITLPLVVRAISHKLSLEAIPNIVYRLDSCQFQETIENQNNWHPIIADDLLPAYHKVNMDAYYGDRYIRNQLIKKRGWGAIQASRGCPYSCSFCYNFWGKRVRKRNPESIVEEMRLLEKRFHIDEVIFIDFTFTYDRSWVMEICELIKRANLKIKWCIETRCDLIDSELVKILDSARCKRIWLGIESFDESILKISNKYQTSDVIYSAIDAIKQTNIQPGAFIMLGLPGENIGTLNKTIQEIYKNALVYTKSIILSTPRFGTHYYELAKKQYTYIGDNWLDLDAIKGQVANEMRPSLLQRAITLMKNRSFVYQDECH
jgi:anaerobic magnesium-protoporphyrin IX monomethyl ester cyclase